MRNIKFKVWNKIRESMIPFANSTKNWSFSYLNQDNFVWLEYTGINYSEENPMCESDIVLWTGTNKNGDTYNHTCIVVFDSKEWNGWALQSNTETGTVPIGIHGAKIEELTLLGNLFEHPELLKLNES